MMGRLMAFIVVIVCSAQAVLLRAQEPSLDVTEKRFTFHRIDDGYLRLDLRSGDVATCRQREGGLTCTLAPDERAALDNEIGRLQRENAALKNALLERGLPLPSPPADAPALAGPASPPVASESPQTSPPAPALPPVASAPPRPPAPIPAEPGLRPRDNAEIDRVMDAVERLWHRLVELMTSIQRDPQKKS
jgi:hypothetical protein